jgi:hypothetical protein
MDKGGGGAPPREQQVATPTEQDPNVQKKKAARMTAARYAQGFRSTIASGQPDQALGNSTGAQPGAAGSTGTLTKLG